jgi:hypothetical protein
MSYSLGISHEGSSLDVNLNGTLYLFSNRDNHTIWKSNVGLSPVPSALASATGDYFATNNSSSLSIFGRYSNVSLATLAGTYPRPRSFSDDGSILIYDSGSQAIAYDWLAKKELVRGDAQSDGVVSGDGSRIVMFYHGPIRIYDRTGSEICSTSGGFEVAISPNGQYIAALDFNSFYFLQAIAQPEQLIPYLIIIAGVGGGVLVAATGVVVWKRRRAARPQFQKRPDTSRITSWPEILQAQR